MFSKAPMQIDFLFFLLIYQTFILFIFFYSTQYTFISAAHRTFSKIEHILGHKASLSKYRKIEIIPCTLSDHNAIKLGLNNKNKDKKHANSWKLNNSLVNEQCIIDEIKEEIKRFLEVNENENTIYRNLWEQQRQS
jgi:hypothetical protein